MYTPAPRPKIVVNKDTSNHPLWAFPAKKGSRAGSDSMLGEAEAGRMGRFARRYERHQRPQQSVAAASPSEGMSAEPVRISDVPRSTAEADLVARGESLVDLTVAPNDTSSSPPPSSNDMFDLSLDGEEYDPSKQVVVAEGKKAKASKGGKKGGKK